jgi:hypothetical protein
MYSVQDLPKGGVAPFGHPRINDRSHLPAAFRSVPRPSSPLGAKASTERPSHTQTLLPPARRIHPRLFRDTQEHHMSNRTAATPRTLTSYGLSAVRAYTRYHQIFFTMRNNNGTPAARTCAPTTRWFSGSSAIGPQPDREFITFTWRLSDSNR